MAARLKSPYPYFGGKSRCADVIWDRLGNPTNFVEPFFGSGAVLLARPIEPRIETINDLNGYLSNFWRAIQADPEAVAHYADWPINETDLHSRHRWLVDKGAPIVAKLAEDPEFYDAKIAGWWVWGASCWIGSGWCPIDGRELSEQKPYLRVDHGASGQGVTRSGLSQQLPSIARGGERGVVSPSLARKRPNIGDEAAGRGMLRVSQKRPHLHRPAGIHADQHSEDRTAGDSLWIARPQLTHEQGIQKALHQTRPDLQDSGGRGVHSTTTPLAEYFAQLSDRLRRVRVCCGDWKRVVTPAVLLMTDTDRNTKTAVFLDPPYADTAGRKADLYSSDSLTVAHDVREWAIANGDNPKLRICLAGYLGEHVMPDSWECVAWKTNGGYANQGDSRENKVKERLWFSPLCTRSQRGLFD